MLLKAIATNVATNVAAIQDALQPSALVICQTLLTQEQWTAVGITSRSCFDWIR